MSKWVQKWDILIKMEIIKLQQQIESDANILGQKLFHYNELIFWRQGFGRIHENVFWNFLLLVYSIGMDMDMEYQNTTSPIKWRSIELLTLWWSPNKQNIFHHLLINQRKNCKIVFSCQSHQLEINSLNNSFLTK